MDFGKTDFRALAEAGAVLQLTNPETGEKLTAGKTPCTITLRGAESRMFKNKAERMGADRVVRMKAREVAGGILTAEQVIDEADRVRGEARELLAFATVSWTGIVWEGEELTCNEFNAIKLYKAQPFVQAQVDKFVEAKANFFTPA